MSIAIGEVKGVLSITSDAFDRPKKLITFTAQGLSAGKVGTYIFKGTFILMQGQRDKILGTCQCPVGEEEAEFFWNVSRLVKRPINPVSPRVIVVA